MERFLCKSIFLGTSKELILEAYICEMITGIRLSMRESGHWGDIEYE